MIERAIRAARQILKRRGTSQRNEHPLNERQDFHAESDGEKGRFPPLCGSPINVRRDRAGPTARGKRQAETAKATKCEINCKLFVFLRRKTEVRDEGGKGGVIRLSPLVCPRPALRLGESPDAGTWEKRAAHSHFESQIKF